MNHYLRNLNKIEFVVTYACTGRCRHCSEGDHPACGEQIDPAIAADAVRRIAEAYDIKTVMAFGGEPLLYPETVYVIMNAALEMRIPRRQVITNGYFSKRAEIIAETAQMLAECGVNDLLLSVDAFHQETIPIEVVKRFAEEVVKCGIPIRLQPAWLVCETDGNPYNTETRRVLSAFGDMQIPISNGNIIFPEGNALKYLGEYFVDAQPENPYVENPWDIRCISVSHNGDVLGGNLYERDILEIIKEYIP